MFDRIPRVIKAQYHKSSALRLVATLASPRVYGKPGRIVLLDDLCHKSRTARDDATHANRSLAWIFRAQDKADTGGVSGGYRLAWGWMQPFPEVEGYLIPTVLRYPSVFGASLQTECILRAQQMGDWLLAIQHSDGSFVGGLYPSRSESWLFTRFSWLDKPPMVFDTAQALQGLVALHNHTRQTKYLAAAIRAGDWITAMQDDDGSWSRFVYNDLRVVYYTRVDWPLLQLWLITHDGRYCEAACRHAEWTLRHQQPNGWFVRAAFFDTEWPLTHTICYTLEGLIESGILLNEPRYIAAAARTAERLLRIFSIRGFRSLHDQNESFMPARFDSSWRSVSSYACLTGNAQLAVVWLRLYQLQADIRYLNGALRIIDHLKSTQYLDSGYSQLDGGIKGSDPIWGDYMIMSYRTWAVKFFIDALIEKVVALECFEETQVK